MPLNTFPIPKRVSKYFPPNRFGIPDDIYTAIVLTAAAQVQTASQLTDAANIATDASLASTFYVTLAGNRNMSAPTNPTDWKLIRYYITQDVVGNRTLTWNPIFRFSTAIPSPTLTTTASFSDYIEFMFNPTYLTWDCFRVTKGFDTTTPP